MRLVENMAKEMAKEIESKTREFYEFVLPPVDMTIKDDYLLVTVDVPGFDKKDIDITQRGKILHIKARKKRVDDMSDAAKDNADNSNHDYKIICAQRPNFIDKKIRLPISVYGASKKEEGKNDEDTRKSTTAKYDNGVLLITIPIRKRRGLVIPID